MWKQEREQELYEVEQDCAARSKVKAVFTQAAVFTYTYIFIISI